MYDEVFEEPPVPASNDPDVSTGEGSPAVSPQSLNPTNEVLRKDLLDLMHLLQPLQELLLFHRLSFQIPIVFL